MDRVNRKQNYRRYTVERVTSRRIGYATLIAILVMAATISYYIINHYNP